jgi:holo-ACP synthase
MMPVYRETINPITGSEAYVAVYADAGALKELVINIENQHPLGRLFDFDVIGRDGFNISREVLGYAKRKCLICDEYAHACARSKRHTIEELTEKIQGIADNYFNISGELSLRK